jgi:hypothetical protein
MRCTFKYVFLVENLLEETFFYENNHVVQYLSQTFNFYCNWSRSTLELGWCSRYSNWLDDKRGRSLSTSKVKNFLFTTSSRLALGPTQPTIQWVLGVLSPGVKWLGREADQSPPTGVKVKKMWIYTTTPPYAFMA